MNQGGNQRDDSTGQHCGVTGHTAHMQIRPAEREGERETGREGEREGERERGRELNR